MNYTNREVVKRLKQYDMFLNSLKLTSDEVQKERICDQLDKIEKQILLDTNTEYEEEYTRVLSDESRFLDEEKSKLRKLISIVTNRRNYLNERKKRHKDVTGSLVELTTFLGEDKLTMYKNNLKIIEKYEENKIITDNIIHDMKDLDVKISSASRNVKANARLNDMLENKMINLIERALDKLGLFNLTNKKDDLYKKYDSLKYAMDMALDNLNSAKEIKDEEMVLDCNEMLNEITKEYEEYNKQINILKLIDVYENPVNGYEELLEKRTRIDSILRNIENTDLYNEINDELCKEYNTIKLEKQDLDNYDNLKDERERKNKKLTDIEEENNSPEFKDVLDRLIKNEKNYRDEQVRKARKIENEERERKFLENKRIEEARVRRQKLIEDARLKDQLKRAEELKKIQEKTAINLKKEEEFKDKLKSFEEKIESKINNYPADKIFEDTNLSDDFNSEELFENTKIVPNKINNSDLENNILNTNLNDDVNSKPINVMPEEKNVESTPVLPQWDIPEPINDFPDMKEPLTEDAFKEEKAVKVEVETPAKKENSIYDLLENSNNIIWQTTDDKNKSDTIPIIGNNNLKPEIVNKKNDEFPELGNKGGEILWKETL